MRRMLVVLIALFTLAGCGAEPSATATTSGGTAEESAESVEAEDPPRSLADFLGDGDTPMIAGMPDMNDDTTTSDDGSEGDGESVAHSEAASMADGEAIAIQPASVPSSGEYTVAVSGSGFGGETDVLLVSCVVPGDQIRSDISEQELLTRLVELIPSDDCDVARAVQTTSDTSGMFTVDLTTMVDQNVVIYAALPGSAGGAYALLPVAA